MYSCDPPTIIPGVRSPSTLSHTCKKHEKNSQFAKGPKSKASFTLKRPRVVALSQRANEQAREWERGRKGPQHCQGFSVFQGHIKAIKSEEERGRRRIEEKAKAKA